MNIRKFLFWLPKVTLIIVAFLFWLFSLDVFTEDWGLSEKLIGFFAQNIPTTLIVLFLWLSWKKEALASLLFFAFFVVAFFFFRLHENMISFLVIGLPLLLVSALFFYNHKNKNQNYENQ